MHKKDLHDKFDRKATIRITMSFLTLTPTTYSELDQVLSRKSWVICCLCAAWCGSCRDYLPAFETLSSAHPEYDFVWIDIEDEADFIGDIDVENFPTILIQHGETVAFFGTVLPEVTLIERLVLSLTEQTSEELSASINRSPEKQIWQTEYNLYKRRFNQL